MNRALTLAACWVTASAVLAGCFFPGPRDEGQVIVRNDTSEVQSVHVVVKYCDDLVVDVWFEASPDEVNRTGYEGRRGFCSYSVFAAAGAFNLSKDVPGDASTIDVSLEANRILITYSQT